MFSLKNLARKGLMYEAIIFVAMGMDADTMEQTENIMSYPYWGDLKSNNFRHKYIP